MRSGVVDGSSRTPLGMAVTWARTIKARRHHLAPLTWQTVLANHDGSIICLAYQTAGEQGQSVSAQIAFVDGLALEDAGAWERYCTDELVSVDKADYWINL